MGLKMEKKTLLYWTLIVVLLGLFIGFLVAWIKERDANSDGQAGGETTPAPPTAPPLDPGQLRLNDTIFPINYKLSIRSDPREGSFLGTVTIDLDVREATDRIVLHCKDLKITSYSIDDTVIGDPILYDATYELCTFMSNKRLEVGEHKLWLHYTGDFKLGQITGFYNSSYLSLDNEVHYLTATKFEPTYARLAYPCFDEPKFKSTYEISIVHPNHLKALSNEIEIGSKPDETDGWTETSFRKTVPMSTYLVAFIVCDFEYTETKTTFGTRVRVYSRPDQVEKTRFALDAAATVLRHYENYTGIEYALGKFDLIGLPEFVSGAMENWGLVTYKETAILFSPTDSSSAEQRSIAGTIAHEIAHMWWGNLVTVGWWSELWLNEGWASYIEYKGQNRVNAKWNIFDRFLISDLHSAMRADSLRSAHPLKNTEVITPNQITAQFDTITYSKGAAILRMLENIIGASRFQEASKKYLEDNKYKVTTTDQLLKYFDEALLEVTKVAGTTFMAKWVEQNGFPIVQLERIGETKVKLTQVRYSGEGDEDDDDEPWHLQVVYLLPNGQTGSWVLTKMSDTFDLPAPIDAKQFIKLNKGGDYYYISNYSEADWSLLAKELKQGRLDSVDRANLIFDAYQLADKSRLSYEIFFSLLDSLPKEKNYLPWSVSVTAINSLFSKLSTSNGASLMKYQNYIRKIAAQAFDSTVDVSLADASALSPDQLSQRGNLISLACKVEYEACLNMCYDLFRKYLDQGVKVDPNIRTYVYSYGLQNSKLESDWLRFWDMYMSEKDALEKAKLMAALTKTKNAALISLLIDYSKNQAKVNNENFFSLQSNIAASSDIGRSMIWDYIRNDWLVLVDRFGLNDRRLGNYVRSVTSGFGTQSRLTEMLDFFTKFPEAGAGEAARQQALETVRQNIAWSEKNEAKISESLVARDETESPWLNWRLDSLVRPSHYKLSLTIDVDEEVFEGSVEIDISVGRPLNYLILHSKDLTITEAGVYTSSNNKSVSSSKGQEYKPNQFWIIPMERILVTGDYVARLQFKGKLSHSMTGLYVSKYTDSETNTEVKLATTQFEAVYARWAFPCFDEPGFKATFKIDITHHKKYSAISNMPVDYILPVGNERLTTAFQTTLKMSTYPLAFVVSNFVPKTDASSSISFSIYTYNPKVNLNKVDYALATGPAVLNFLSNYFDIQYPLPKLDMISVPDFSMGAMENWGLVTYRDVYILYDPSKSSSASKMTVCYIIAHELSHMWFGDLTTMRWWNNLWLNEGFAQMMQYKAVGSVEPSWNYHEHFSINELARVFEADSSQATRAILSPVHNENDIQAAFDSVTYAKGASILRMLENTMGEQDFRQGVSNYLKKYSYQNTETDDLWQELTKASHEQLDIKDLMTGWLKTEGFPVVTVTIDANRKVSLKQERFMKDFSYTNSTDVWNIPLTYRLVNTKNVELEPSTERLQLKTKALSTDIVIGADELIKFNIDQMGVYILNYPTDVWRQWAQLLGNDSSSVAWQRLSALDRANLLSDAFYLSRSGRLSYEVSLELAKFLKFEDSYVVWRVASSMFNYLSTFAQREDRGVAINAWLISELLDKKHAELGWEAEKDENINRKRLRALIADMACEANHEGCLKKASDKFEEYMSSKKNQKRSVADYVYDPDLFNIFLVHAMRTVTDTEGNDKYEFMQKQYESAQTTDEKLKLLSGMTSVKSVDKLKKLVDKSLESGFIRRQDFFTFLAYMSSNPLGIDLAWDFFRENYKTIEQSFGLDDSNIGRAVYRFAFYFSTEARLKEVRQLYEKYPEAGASQLYRQQAIELIEANIAWSKKHYNTVIETFTNSCIAQLCPWNIYRLNPNVVPSLYDLTIQVNTETNLYNGTVKTSLAVTAQEDKPVTHLIMHAASILNVNAMPKVHVATNALVGKNSSSKAGDLDVDHSFRYPTLEFYVIKLKQPIKNNIDIIVEVGFDGSLLLGGQAGLYRGWYEFENKTINLAATQFESTHARKVFPCFDEPTYKPEIEMTIIHPEAKTLTLSNMPLVSTVDHAELPGWKVAHFERSIKMPTYLIAILVSDFECSSGEIKVNGVRSYPVAVRICSSKIHDQKKRQYALDTTIKVIEAYEDKLKQPYQLTKLDQVAIPQFSAGAMENWGLIKYRESALLWTEEEYSAASQRSVASIIAHELAHMYFGNQVTCQFWGDLVLNEGFASFFEFVAVNAIAPEWNYFDLFAYYDTMGAMLTDSQETSLSVVREVNRPAEMPYNNSITYNKGSAMLNMLYHLMGEEKFMNGLNKYLVAYANGTVVTENLLTTLEGSWDYSDKIKLTPFMDVWLRKAGFPYLNVTFDSTKKTYSYRQERFLVNGNRPKEDTVYPIPFNYYNLDAKTRELKKSPVVFLQEKTGTLPDNVKGFIKINPDFGNFYLVNYPAEYWKELADRLVENKDNLVDKLSVNDRVELIWSAYLLTRAKLVDYLTTFKLYNYLVNEKHFAPWYFYSYTMSSLALRMSFTEYRESILQYEQRLTRPHYKDELWDNSGNNVERQFKTNMITISCRAGNTACSQKAYDRLQEWKQAGGTREKLPANLQGNILNYGVRQSKASEDYEFVWEAYKKEKKDTNLKLDYLYSLTMIEDFEQLKLYLERVLDERSVSTSSYVSFFNMIIEGYAHQEQIWTYFNDNYAMLAKKLSTAQVSSILNKFASYTITKAKRDKLAAFLTAHPEIASASVLSLANDNLSFMDKHKTEVGEWFSQNACGDLKPTACAWSRLRLDKTIMAPKQYDVTIQVNLTTNIYNGSVSIDVNATKEFDVMLLHVAEKLTVTLDSVRRIGSDTPINVARVGRYQPNDYLVLHFDGKQAVGEYVVGLKFSAKFIDSELSGLYLSTYNDADLKKKSIASTQFEFHDARKVIPSFDEPAFKSIFKMTIIHDAHMNATLTNMKSIESVTLPGTNWVSQTYAPSPPMSSYLVAMMVSDFVQSTRTVDGIQWSVYASPRQQHKMDYALEKAPLCLKHLTERLSFKQPPALDKIDLLAIPSFYYGAMENWGLVTFRETALLYHESDTTAESKMSILGIIAHELAHFWFGNTITCENWNYLFLNEAFATYMQYTTVKAVEPDWKYDEHFLSNAMYNALNADASATAHPMVRDIQKTSEIAQMNSNIIYSKGASLLRMIEFVIGGETNFYAALAAYFQEYQYSNVVPQNLFDMLEPHFTPNDRVKNITDLLQEWIFKNGYPYVNVSREDDNGNYRFVQHRFLLSGKSNDEPTVWKIPISYYADDKFSTSATQFLVATNETLSGLPKAGLIKVNVKHTGFYLTNYSPELWSAWIAAMVEGDASTKLSVHDRAGFLIDSFFLARANLLSYYVPLSLSRYLTKETEFTPWNVGIAGLNQIRRYMKFGSTLGDKFEQHVISLALPQYQQLGWTETKGADLQNRIRAMIFYLLCSYNQADCLATSADKFQEWKTAKVNNQRENLISPNLMLTVLKHGLKTKEDWLFVWSEYLNASSPSLKQIYLRALADADDQESVNMLLVQAFEGKLIPSHDTSNVVATVGASFKKANLETLWTFFKANFVRLSNSTSSAALNTALNSLCSNYFFTSAQKTSLQAFFDQHSKLISTSQRTKALDAIDNNIRWIETRAKEVENFLLCQAEKCPINEFRLDSNIRPERYDLMFTVDLKANTFEGTAKISVDLSKALEASQEVKHIVLHAAPTLNITESTIENEAGVAYPSTTSNYSVYQFFVFHTTQPIKDPKIVLNFKFNSQLSTDMLGFYKSEYFNPETKETVGLASTQFQDLHARRAFPSFDEPSFKAVFHVTLKYHKNYTALSNTAPKQETITEGEWKTTEFADTPKMVTYLLAFVVSDFHCGQDSTTLPDVVVSVCSSPPEKNKIAYSLEMAPKVIDSFNRKFKFSYSQMLPKMHLLAIPDFSAGAMENWGLLTFRETALLYSEEHSTAADKMYVLSVVSHEIGHMWFGNTLTCQWWSDLFLNEGFASYMEYFSMDEVEPSWNYLQLFYTTDYISGMNADSSATAHPLIRSVKKPSEIPYISNIIYQKGASILRMFNFVLGDNFYTLLGDYIKKYQYDNVRASNLIDVLGTASVENLDDVKGFLESWTLKAGFPYVNVTKVEGNKYKLDQARYISKGTLKDNSQRYIVPVSYYDNDGKVKVHFMKEQSETTELAANTATMPLKLNTDAQGFYIVNYDIATWNSWAEVLQSAAKVDELKLTSQDLASMLFDAFNLAKVRLLPYENALKLTTLLRHSEQFPVWSTGSTIFGNLLPYFQTSDTSGINQLMQAEFKAYAQSLVAPLYNKYGLQASQQTDLVRQRLHSTISSFACAYGLVRCQLEARVEFQKWRQDQVVSPNQIVTVLRYALQDSKDASDWEYVWQRYEKETTTSVKLNYLQGLAQTSNVDLLNRLFERANNQTLVRRQNYLSIYSYSVRNPTGFKFAWSYFKTNYKNIQTNRVSQSGMGTLATYFANRMYTQEQKTDFEQFYNSHPDVSISQTNLNNALQVIDQNIRWVDKYRQTVYAWLKTTNDAKLQLTKRAS